MGCLHLRPHRHSPAHACLLARACACGATLCPLRRLQRVRQRPSAMRRWEPWLLAVPCCREQIASSRARCATAFGHCCGPALECRQRLMQTTWAGKRSVRRVWKRTSYFQNKGSQPAGRGSTADSSTRSRSLGMTMCLVSVHFCVADVSAPESLVIPTGAKRSGGICGGSCANRQIALLRCDDAAHARALGQQNAAPVIFTVRILRCHLLWTGRQLAAAVRAGMHCGF